MHRGAIMKGILVGIIAIGASGIAHAADLPLKAPAATAPLSWSGIYLGVHGGGAYSDVDFFLPASLTNVAGNCVLFATCPTGFGGHTATGGLVGGQTGVNYQAGMWLVGAEVEAAWTNLKGGAISTFPIFAFAGLSGNSRVDAIYDISARAGIVAGRALFFAKGGAAWARDSYWIASPVLTMANSVSDTRMGWIAGVGAEYDFQGPWTAKVEYDYLDFGRKRETLTGPVDFDIKQNIHLVKAGVSYRFGGW